MKIAPLCSIILYFSFTSQNIFFYRINFAPIIQELCMKIVLHPFIAYNHAKNFALMTFGNFQPISTHSVILYNKYFANYNFFRQLLLLSFNHILDRRAQSYDSGILICMQIALQNSMLTFSLNNIMQLKLRPIGRQYSEIVPFFSIRVLSCYLPRTIIE